MRVPRWIGVAVGAGALAACNPPRLTQDPPPDSGTLDAGHDAGNPVRDAGSLSDAGAPDAAVDSGSVDSGTVDAGPPRADVPGIACTDSLANVYITPANLPPMTDATRGDVVRCAYDSSLDAGTVSAKVKAKGISTQMGSGVALYRIAFRTERGDGSPGMSTARVYLPQAALPLPLPVIDIGHPTVGMAAACTPSMDESSNEDLALPWAGLGFAVIVPDYAGQGNGGAQGYLDNRDQAHSMLDGARALRKLLVPGTLAPRILAVGFSQGGGAVLSAQALAQSYGADGELVGAIAFAPEWPTRLNSFGMVDQLRNPNELTILTGLSEDVVSVTRTYSYFYNHVGPAHAGDGFPDAGRSGIVNAVTSLCEVVLGGYLQAAAVHVGDITDPTFRNTLLDCIQNGQGDPGCLEPGKSYDAFLEQNFVTADPQGAKVLYVQGLLDPIMPPASEAACNIQKLHGDGVIPQVCTDGAADHLTVVGRNMDLAMRWGLAVLDGQPLPTCSDAGMPGCFP